MLRRSKTRDKLARNLKLTLPVAPIEKPERTPVLPGVKETRRLEERVSYRCALPISKRPRRGNRGRAILSNVEEVEPFTRVASGREAYEPEGQRLGTGRRAWPTSSTASPSPRRVEVA